VNRSVKPSFRATAPVFAAAAVLTVLVIAGGIEGPIAHYRAESQLANFHPSRLVAPAAITQDLKGRETAESVPAKADIAYMRVG